MKRNGRLTARPNLASSRLANNIIADFRDAMDAVVLAAHHESLLAAQYCDGTVPGRIERDATIRACTAYADAAEKCRAHHLAALRLAEQQLAEEWAGSADENLRRIGEALRTRDWSGLAI